MDTLSILSSFLSILVTCTGFSKADTKSQHFSIHEGQRFKAELDHFEGEAINMMQCANMCYFDKNCTSASFNDVVGTCLLSEVHVHEPNGGQEMIVESSWTALSTNVDPRYGGWVPVGKSWFLVQLLEINVVAAKQFCEQHGGWLAEPRDANAHRLLSNFLKRNFDRNCGYWIGLKGGYGNTTFVWDSDGQVPPYTKWHNAYEPHVAYGTNFVVLYLFPDNNEFRWADDNTQHAYRAVCQASWLA